MVELSLDGVKGLSGAGPPGPAFRKDETMNWNLQEHGVWQQAAGDTDRDCSDLCLEWDVILNGPGAAGPWPECIDRLDDLGVSARKISDLRRFCEKMQNGDYVVLRLGTSLILGVGQVIGDYQWREEFGDIDGWDLEHVRRVRWLWKHGGDPKRFPTYTLKQGDTTQRLDSDEVMDWIAGLKVSAGDAKRRLTSLPDCTGVEEVSLETISDFLFDHGVASGSIGHLLDEMGELVRIAKWYQRSSAPSEQETVTYLVAPLLRALGWTPQMMAIEWNKVDLALFGRLPRENHSLSVVVEAKKMNASCLSAASQAESYARGNPNCRRLIVTDGLRYGVYVKNRSRGFQLHAYMNLTNLKNTYPVYRCEGASEALLTMAPEWRDG